MQCDLIIMGAMGRMGATLTQLAQQGSQYNLKAVVERPERSGSLGALEPLGCVVSSDLKSVLERVPGATIIDFTAPEASVQTCRVAAEFGNPVVVGTTGLDEEQQKELAKCAEKTPVFWAPNMSVGVNVLLKVLPMLVEMLGPDYDMEMVEIHHKMKADSPSGTALKLAQCMAEARGWNYDDVKKHCRDGIIGPREKDEMGVQTVRGGDVVGDHTAYFLGPGERIEITHRAHSRETFAQGAMRAAEWLCKQKPGKLYSMDDIF